MASATARTPTVYVVDDHAVVLESIQVLLQSMGWRAVGYRSCREFLDAVDLDGAGCLVLDLGMPEMSGLDLVNELARRGSRLPVIVVSGHASLVARARAAGAPVVAFLEKPFKGRDLARAIEDAMGQGAADA
jgi:two-component system response regulator FixJ